MATKDELLRKVYRRVTGAFEPLGMTPGVEDAFQTLLLSLKRGQLEDLDTVTEVLFACWQKGSLKLHDTHWKP